jgi:hypothetical protein
MTSHSDNCKYYLIDSETKINEGLFCEFVAIHDAFQMDLLRLRLKTAKSCEAALSSSTSSNPISSSQPLRLAAQVRGLGPTFQLIVELENMAEKDAMIGLAIVLHYDTKIYQVGCPFVKVK